MLIQELTNSLLSVVYPQECRICSRLVESLGNGIACNECWSATRIFDGSEMLCSKCGAFLGSESGNLVVTCHQCDQDHYQKAIAVGVYEKALSASILELKSTPRLSARLNSLLKTRVEALSFFDPDLIVPVPLSKLRRLERGFNQAEIIATEIARNLKLTVDASSLARVRHSPIHRVGMDRKARESTINNAFKVLRPKLFEGKNIILVDDLFTSGATTSNCSKVLKQNGARQIIVFTLARAVYK